MANETKKVNLVIPEVLSAAIAVKMINEVKLSPLAEINTDLQGKGGDTITIPQYNYIGDAQVLAEGETGTVSQLSATSKTATIAKLFTAVEISDESVLSNFSNPLEEAEKQLSEALGSKIEKDCFTALEASLNVYTDTVNEISTGGISDAAANLFADDMEGIYMFVTAKQYTKLRKEAAFIQVAGGNAFITGVVGDVFGVKIVLSKYANALKNVMLQAGGLQIALKRDIQVETDRDILRKMTVVSADSHCVAHILNTAKVGVAKFKAAV